MAAALLTTMMAVSVTGITAYADSEDSSVVIEAEAEAGEETGVGSSEISGEVTDGAADGAEDTAAGEAGAVTDGAEETVAGEADAHQCTERQKREAAISALSRLMPHILAGKQRGAKPHRDREHRKQQRRTVGTEIQRHFRQKFEDRDPLISRNGNAEHRERRQRHESAGDHAHEPQIPAERACAKNDRPDQRNYNCDRQ